MFIHGLWLLAGSWDPWRSMIEAAGYATVAVDWPDDPAKDILIPGGSSKNSLCVLDVSPFWEIRGFFDQRQGEITLSLQILAPNHPGAEPSPSNGYVICSTSSPCRAFSRARTRRPASGWRCSPRRVLEAALASASSPLWAEPEQHPRLVAPGPVKA